MRFVTDNRRYQVGRNAATGFQAKPDEISTMLEREA